MSVQAIGLTSILPNSYSLGGPQAVDGLAQPTQSQNTGQVSDPDGDGDSGRISQVGQLLSKLEKLKQQDPTKFKQVLSQIADQLSAAAQQQAPGDQAQFLTKLADRFKSAAETGDLTQLQPGHGSHHHHQRVQQAYGQNQQDPQQVLVDSLQNAGQHPALSTDTQKLLSNIFDQLNNTLAGL